MTRSRWDDVVTGVLVVLLAGGALWGVGAVVIHGLLAGWERQGYDARTLHAGVLLLLGAGWLGCAALVGPVAASRAHLQWWTGMLPGDRTGTLVVLSMCAATVLSLTFVVAPSSTTQSIGPAALLCMVMQVLSMAAWQGQRADARELVVAAASCLALLSLAAVALASEDTVIALLLGAATFVALVVSAARFPPSAPGDAPPRWLLVRAADHRWALGASVVLLDGTIARHTHERWGRRTTRVPRSIPTVTGPMLTRVGTLLVRQLGLVLQVGAPSLYVAHQVAQVWTPEDAATVVALAMAGLGVVTGVHVDSWADAPSLRRTYAAMPTATVLVPSTLCLLGVALAAVAVLRPGLLAAAVLIALAPLVVVRRSGARGSGLVAWVSSPMGAVPLAEVNRLVAGWDVAVGALLALNVL